MKDLGQIGFQQAAQATESATGERLTRLAERLEKSESAVSPEDAEQLRKQARAFESMLVKTMLDSMRRTVQKSDLFGDSESNSRNIYQSMLDGEYAKMMSEQQGFGLADLILEHFGVPSEELADLRGSLKAGLAPYHGAENAGSRSEFLLPATGRISSPFGMRSDPFTGQLRMHKGLDIAMPEGRKIYSALDGEVVFAGEKAGYGKVVEIKHRDDIRTIYGHLDEINVDVGDKIRRGRIIARSGNTGRSTGPHLHFEIRVGGRPVNPENYIRVR